MQLGLGISFLWKRNYNFNLINAWVGYLSILVHSASDLWFIAGIFFCYFLNSTQYQVNVTLTGAHEHKAPYNFITLY